MTILLNFTRVRVLNVLPRSSNIGVLFNTVGTFRKFSLVSWIQRSQGIAAILRNVRSTTGASRCSQLLASLPRSCTRERMPLSNSGCRRLRVFQIFGGRFLFLVQMSWEPPTMVYMMLWPGLRWVWQVSHASCLDDISFLGVKFLSWLWSVELF